MNTYKFIISSGPNAESLIGFNFGRSVPVDFGGVYTLFDEHQEEITSGVNTTIRVLLLNVTLKSDPHHIRYSHRQFFDISGEVLQKVHGEKCTFVGQYDAHRRKGRLVFTPCE